MAGYPENRFPAAILETDKAANAAGFINPVHCADSLIDLAGDGVDAAGGAEVLAGFATGTGICVDVGHLFDPALAFLKCSGGSVR